MSTLAPPAPGYLDDLTRRGFIAAGLVASASLVVGCGSTERPRGTGSETREVTDFLGPTTIPARPQRVVADSVSIYAHLVTLGVTPVGAAIPVGISTSYFAPADDPITNVVADDGWTVDLEEALTLRPDLILAVGADYNEDNCTRYRAAMATYCFEEGWVDAADVEEKLLILGQAIGREQEARKAIDAYDARVAAAKGRLAGRTETFSPVGTVRFDAAGFIGVRTNDIVQGVFSSLGLGEPKWPEVGPSGYVELSMETLEILNRAKTLFVTTDDDVDIDKMDVFKSGLWKSLKPVASGDAHFVGAWNGGDLLQLSRMVDDIEQALVGET